MSDVIILTGIESIQVVDALTFTLLGSFSHQLPEKKADRSNALISRALPDHLISSCGPFFYAHSYAKEQMIYRSTLPSPLTSIAASEDGNFYIGGTAQGSLYVWDVSTGDLLRTFDAHYKSVTCIAVSGQLIFTSGDDSIVHCWHLGDLVDEGLRKIVPYRTFSEHGLAVSSLHCLLSGSRFVSSSQDRTCKIWDVKGDKCVVSLVFPNPVNAVIVNSQETFLFAACQDGHIYRVNIYPTLHLATDVVHIAGSPEITTLLKAHKSPVTSMALGADTTFLVSISAADGEVIKWDVATSQPVKTLSMVKCAPLRSICIRPKPINLFTPSIVEKEIVSCQPARTGNFANTVKPAVKVHLIRPCTERVSENLASSSSGKDLKEENAQLKVKLHEMTQVYKKMKDLNESMFQHMVSTSLDDQPGQ